MARLSLFIVLVAGAVIALNLVAGQGPTRYCRFISDCPATSGCPKPCCHGELESYADNQTVYAIKYGVCTCCSAPETCHAHVASGQGQTDNTDSDAQVWYQHCQEL